MVDIEKICADAIENAAELGVALRYQPEDIAELENRVMPVFSEWLRNGTITENKGAWNLAVQFGIYLGETMLRNYAAKYGYHWGTPDGDLPVLMKDGGNQMSPITKVHKRILNGAEDSIKSFYDVGVLIADGRFDPARRNLKPHQE